MSDYIYNISNQISQQWKDIIESTNINGYTREVISIGLWSMNKYYTGFPEIEHCYKVTFNFFPTIHQHNFTEKQNEWRDEIIKIFINILIDDTEEKLKILL